MNGILAQLVEHLTFNQVVRGSNPRCLTIEKTWKESNPVGSESPMSHYRENVEGVEPRGF